MDWKLLIAAIIAILIILFVPSKTISVDEVIQKADKTPEAQFFKTLYPDATITVEEKGCVERWFNEYVKDTTVPLVNRDRNFACFEEKKDWVVTYSATGIIDTPGLTVGIKSDDGKIIDAAFTSPYDDVHVLNYSFTTSMGALESILSKNGIIARGGWAVFFNNETRYLIFMIPYPDKTTVLLYIEKTPEYKIPTKENLRSEIKNAHKKFEAGAKKLSSIFRSGFTEDFNVTGYYLYFPEPQY